ncbi:hypothetical protein T190115A13A_320001 [Tenacibaculum sp. 190524A02b]|uniref:Carrier domain-containing protein n=2 Tax=Tenacibaculum vairaonense TaxID=3137860 RepID=A0ABP1F9T1_9FLAO
MVPTLWIELEEMPLTVNGKLDRKALPEPDGSMLSTKEYVAPRNETEEKLVTIWQKLLGVEEIGVYDDFFELGGHSLLATRLVSLTRKELGKEIAIRDIFEYNTISDLGLYISTKFEEILLPSVVVEDCSEQIPLSFSQERLWFLDKLQSSSQEYHIPVVLKLEGNLNISIVEEALRIIINRHEILRTVIYEKEGIGYQKVIESNKWFLHQEAIAKEAKIEKEISDFINLPFDLSKDYMLRSCLYNLDNNQYILACVFHHIASDGWSSGILMSEFDELYASINSQQEVILPELSLQYKDYAIWQRKYIEGRALESQLTYWENKLSGVDYLKLPLDYTRPTIQSTEGSGISVAINKELTGAINTLCKQEGVTMFMFLLSAFKVLLSRYSGQEDICVGTPIANRTQAELEGVIGFFVNTLALRSNLSGNPSFKEVLKEVKTTTLEGYDHQLVPFEKVVDKMVTTRDMSMSPLFQVMFVLQNTPSNSKLAIENVTISEYELEGITSQFDLTLNISENDQGLLLNVEYCTALFKRTTIKQMLVHYQELLSNIINDVTQSIGSLSMLTNEEENQLLNVFNDTALDYPKDKTVVDLFELQAQETPEAIAVVYNGEELTYKELNEKSNQLAQYLISNYSVNINDLVGVVLERSDWLIVAYLATLKVGAAYVPIDPSYPEDRKEYIRKDSGINVIIDNSLLEEFKLTSSVYSINSPSINIAPSDLAYVIYTSGSTGKPKGVMVEHKNLLHLCFWHQSAYNVTSLSRGTLFAGIGFDASVWEIYPYILKGASLYPVSNNIRYDLNLFSEFLEYNTITHAYIPTLLCERFIEEEISLSKITILTGGDALSVNTNTSLNIYNNYGPTETTVVATNYKVVDADVIKIPIGKPINNTQVYITDSTMNLVPLGVVGEICIGGDGVTRGYLNREDLTNEKFTLNPFKEGGKLYKTGDLGRWLPDGNIDFIGRVDNQVKIRGYRIELGEIENVLSNIPSVIQCCVLTKEDSNGTKRLVGYVVLEGDLNKEALQTELKESLPDYMVPTLWIKVNEMPLTANGKLDKKALPEPDKTLLSTKEYVAPRNQTEEQLVVIWKELLGIEKIGVNDDFFELGGHSLLVVQLISRIQKVGYHISVQDVFSNPTIATIGEKVLGLTSSYKVPINRITKNTDRIVPSMLPLLNFDQEDIDMVVSMVDGGVSNIQDLYPLSPLQEGIYYHHLMSDKNQGDTYILPNLLSFKTEKQRTSFIEALQFVINRHDVLRTCFLSENLPNAIQVVLREATLSVKHLDIQNTDVLTELESLMNPGKQWMNVSKAPLLDLKSVDDSINDCYYLMLFAHHLILDHVGLEKVIQEIEFYLSGKESSLPEPVLYRNFIGHTLHSQSINDSERYFKELLGEVKEPTYPFELSNIIGDTSKIEESSILLSNDFSKELRNISTDLGVSTAVLFHAAYGIVVGKCSNKEYAIFGSLFSGRLQGAVGAADSLGLFINTLPFFTELKGSVSEYVLVVKKSLEGLLPYEQTRLSDIHNWSDISNETPLFSALLNYRHSSISSNIEGDNEENDLGITVIDSEERTNYPFTLNVDDYGDIFGLTAQVDTSVGADRMLAFMQKILNQLLEGLKSEKELLVNTLTILPEEEKKQLVEVFNATTVKYPFDKTVLDLFAKQVKNTPEAIAVVYKGSQLTYQELDKRSNQLAHYLRNQDVQIDTLVGICLERSLEMIVGILGILKSGGAYVPIDPTYPKDRIDYMIKDTEISLVLSSADSRETIIEQEEITIISLDTEWHTIAAYSDEALSDIISSDNLAYIIYTSGSTGKPKGVMIEHGNMFNLISWARSNFKDSLEVGMLASTSINFDLSIFEIFTSLISGSKLHLVDNLLSLVEDSEVSVSLMNTVPSVLLGLLESGKIPDTVQTINLAGEPLSTNLVNRIYKESSVSQVFDLYGPSEATTYSTYSKRLVNGIQTIGKPIDNTEIYILNDALELLPIGVIGELCVGGRGVARGYLNREELTQEKFVANPFKDEGKVYKTGDLGRWLPNGTIEYMGRKDNQVKIRGYRIELGEIENTLSQIEGIHNNCVLAKADVNGNNRLVGYVVADNGFDKEDIQIQLKKSLPNYMVPLIWIEMEEMPLMSNGKLDKKALPNPDGIMLTKNEYIAPRNETEEKVVAIWQELLGIEKIGIHDNFFELGGHSLLVVQLITRLQKIGFHIAVKEIFSNATVAIISEKLSSSTSVYQVPANGITIDTDRITPSMTPLLNFEQEDIDKVVDSIKGGVSNIQDMYPLSPLQEGIYFHHLMSNQEEGDPYILSSLLSFTDQSKRKSFIEALQFIINRHDVLRTCVLSEGLPQAVQVVLREVTLSVEELNIDTSEDVLLQLESLKATSKLWIDVSKAPLLNLKTADDISNSKYYLMIDQHHLVLDHVGLDKITSEIILYLSGKESSLLTPVLYRDFIGHTLHSQSINDSKSYFKGLLGEVDEPTYPFELSNIKGNGSDIVESTILLPKKLSKKLRKVSTDFGMSPAVLFHAAYGIVVGRCSNKDYALFGSLFSGRLQGSVGAADSLGLFINTLPFFIELKGNVLEYIDKIKEELRGLLPYEQTPLSSIQNWSGISNEMPLFSALLNFRHTSISQEEEDAEANLGITFIKANERTNYPFSLSVDDYGIDFGLTAQTDPSIKPTRILSYMEEILTQLIEGLINGTSIESLSMLTEKEEIKLLETFNDVSVSYPQDKTLIDLFTNQVEVSPETTAVVYKGKKLTYKELDELSNQLANYLVATYTINSENPIGVVLERSDWLIVSLLAILKTGGAYVPIDPTYPDERKEYILTDSGSILIIDDAFLNTFKESITKYSTESLDLLVKPKDLAYIIYTSGSTGKPKGVMIEHCSIINTLLSQIASFSINSKDNCLQFASPSFDASIWEIGITLLSGASLHIIQEGKKSDTSFFKEFIKENNITFATLPPAFLQLLAVEDLESIKTLVTAGEAIPLGLAKAFSEKYKYVNAYGPTETSICATTYHGAIKDLVPIGKPIHNTQAYILNTEAKLLPIGVVGELCVGGIGVARGYLNREELTRDKFIKSPFKEGARLYRTGDLARWLPNGTLEFIGRKDNQVKIRGYRIELGEIENALSSLTIISQSCVLAKEDASGNKRLIGYVVAEGEFDKEIVQEELKNHLPDYMIPTLWIELETMPLTSNGKIARKSLPSPEGIEMSSKEYMAPRNETEEKLVAVWQELLGIERIGIYDNFFELGGHSLLATRLVSMIRKELEIEIAIQDIFEFSTIEEMSSFIHYKVVNFSDSVDEYSMSIDI